MKNQKTVSGKIAYISCSPHGDPEGIVLENGEFIKVPPHSLIDKDLFEVGADVSVKGDVINDSPNLVIHHAKVTIADSVAADDSVPPHERDELKEQHKKDLKKRKDAPAQKIRITGVVVALGTKPKGEVDRIILDDGTSVHVPKEIELEAKDFEIGASVEVEGELRRYPPCKHLKLAHLRGMKMSRR